MPTIPVENIADAVLQLHVEELSAGVVKRQGDTVRLQVSTTSRDEVVDTVLTHERVEIERIAVGREVQVAPPMRVEGDTTIVSVVEEELVLVRRLILKEEVHFRMVQVREDQRQTVTLRSQDAVVTRISTAAHDASQHESSQHHAVGSTTRGQP